MQPVPPMAMEATQGRITGREARFMLSVPLERERALAAAAEGVEG